MSATTTRKSPEPPPKNRVVIFDTTLRDGEQSPGASMNLDEKIKIALLLEEMGVDVIEAGFPIASNGDFEAVREIAKLVENASVCGLARAGRGDIERCWEAVFPCRAPVAPPRGDRRGAALCANSTCPAAPVRAGPPPAAVGRDRGGM